MASAFALVLSPVLTEIWDGPSERWSLCSRKCRRGLAGQTGVLCAPPSSFLYLLAFFELLLVLWPQGKQRIHDTFSFPEKGPFLPYLTYPLAPLGFSIFSSLIQGVIKPHDPVWLSVVTPLAFCPSSSLPQVLN